MSLPGSSKKPSSRRKRPRITRDVTSPTWFIYTTAIEDELKTSAHEFPTYTYRVGPRWLHSLVSFEKHNTPSVSVMTPSCICGKFSNRKQEWIKCNRCGDLFHTNCSVQTYGKSTVSDPSVCVLCEPQPYGFHPFEGIIFSQHNKDDGDYMIEPYRIIDCKLCYSSNPFKFLWISRTNSKHVVAETQLSSTSDRLLILLRRLISDGNAICHSRIVIANDTSISIEVRVFLHAENFRNSYDPYTPCIRKNVRQWMKLIYPPFDDDKNDESHHLHNYKVRPFSSLHEFYDCIKADNSLKETSEPAGLLSTLLPFQRRALSWMMKREEQNLAINGLIQLIWTSIPLDTGETVYYNRWNGVILSIPVESSLVVNGGILAEEMGLGKTVELLSLILQHPRDSSDRVFLDSGLLRSRATLIISPSLIVTQWRDEVLMHTPHLSVFLYEGVHKFRMSIETLADYDIVLTTYEILRQEVYFAKEDPTVSLRNVKKYQSPRSPLVQIQWWRVCIDEAQMVETTTSKVAEMTSRLSACYLWAVTGTPIGRNGFEDLYGLIVFLRMYPFNRHLWWRWLVTYVYQTNSNLFHAFFRDFMWRNTKSHVEDEISIPPQEDEITRLNFSAIEGHFYDKLYQECRELYEHSQIDTKKQLLLESSLLRLRQSCCHPQITGYASKVGNARIQSMDDVFDMMLRQANSELGSLERMLVQFILRRGMMNELQKKFDDAIEIYRRVLEIIRDRKRSLEDEETIATSAVNTNQDNKLPPSESDSTEVGLSGSEEAGAEEEEDDTIENDRLGKTRKDSLRLWRELEHRALFNLASVYLELENKTVSDALFADAESVRKQIMATMEESVTRSMRRLGDFQQDNSLFADASLCLPMPRFSGGLLSKDLFTKLHKLIESLNQDVDELKSCHQTIVTIGLQSAHTNYEEDALRQEEGNRCLDTYMSKLLPRRKERILGTRFLGTEMVASRPTDNDLRWELSLKACLHEMKYLFDRPILPEQERLLLELSHRELHEVIESQINHLKEMDRELTEIRRVYNAKILFYRLLQRLSDAVSIPQVADPKAEELLAIRDEDRLRIQVRKAESRKRYLEHLATATSHGQQDHTCGVCRGTIHVGLLTPCGHLFCEQCLLSWTLKHRRCPLCAAHIGGTSDNELRRVIVREVETLADNLQQYDHVGGSRFSNQIDSKAIKLEGSFGTKIAAILRHIKYLNELEPDVKCLVFSQWELMLDILARAFDKNSISYVKLEGSIAKHQAVSRFNHEASVKVLMLNTNTQSSGLTLIRATHIFLVEPLLNRAVEMQAIHRVYRIGQTKTTYVHRYIIRDTIEEQLYRLSEERRSQAHIDYDIDQACLTKTTRHPPDRLEPSDIPFLLRLDATTTSTTLSPSPPSHPSSLRDLIRIRCALAAESRCTTTSFSPI
jgi:E3 ubiquitin-protein ligase SHPRH